MSGAGLSTYWVSWYAQPGWRFTLHWPWWVSGQRVSDDASTIVAAVQAADEGAARAVVLGAQDEGTAVDLEWRFVEEVTDPAWSPYSGRFPAAEWMPHWPPANPAELTQLSVGEAAPQWSCGRCDSFAARGFDDGQITEHHRTCQHAGVGAGPQADALAAVLALHQWHPTHNDQCMCGRAPGDWSDLEEGNRVMAAHQLDALRDAGFPLPPVQPASPRSDLTGLGAREAGHAVYPATDARSTDQDVTG